MLHMQLFVNDQRIGYLMVQRVSPLGRPAADDVCQYRWEISLDGKTTYSVDGEPLVHRFGDGAWTLVSRVLDAAGYTLPPDVVGVAGWLADTDLSGLPPAQPVDLPLPGAPVQGGGGA